MGSAGGELEAYQNNFRVKKKNFKKVLAVSKKLYTFALANQGQQ